MASGSPDRAAPAAFVAAVTIGGANFIAVRYSNEELDPTWGAALRFSLGAAIFIGLTGLRRVPLPKGRALAGAALYGLLGFGAAYFFLYYSLVGLQAGTASVFIAAAPLFTLILAVATGQERLTTRAVAGATLAVTGIAVLSSEAFGGDLSMLYLGSAFLAVMSVAISAVVIKNFPRSHPLSTNAVGMSAGAIALMIVSLIQGERWVFPTEAQSRWALAWLVSAGSVALFALYIFLITRWSASATNYVITMMPVVAVTLGAVIADEKITLSVIAGGVLVVLAVYVGALTGQKPTGSMTETSGSHEGQPDRGTPEPT